MKTRQKAHKSLINPLNLRLIKAWGVMMAGILVLTLRLYQLQIIQGDQLQTFARQQQMVSLNPYQPRRSIVDSQNNILATDTILYRLYVHPPLVKEEPQEIAQKLADVLPNYNQEQLLNKFKQWNQGIIITDQLTESLANNIRELSLEGISLQQIPSRFYPQNDMVAEIIGYVDRDHIGQAGIEYSQRELLKRNLSQFPIRRNGKGSMMPVDMPDGILKLDDLRLQLTIDLRLQQTARDALNEKIDKYRAKRGVVIIMDVADGSLLALASEPTYNPNKYYQYSIDRFKNWAVADLYEPGSTFKPINVAIALEEGVIEPDTYINDTGKIEIDGWPIKNYDYETEGAYGYVSITKILEKSINVGMIDIIQRIDPKDYYDSLINLGLTEKVGVDLPGDTTGSLKREVNFVSSPVEAATTAFGQGFSLTPLKLVQLHAALANGGKLVQPHVVQGLVDSEGELHWQVSVNSKPVFSPETTQAVLEMMESVVANGSGKTAHIPGYRIGGKTGTAQKASIYGGYGTGKITSFVAILPIDKPRYVVLAVVDEPQGYNTFGSTVAAPIVKSVMETLIAIKGIPPSGVGE